MMCSRIEESTIPKKVGFVKNTHQWDHVWMCMNAAKAQMGALGQIVDRLELTKPESVFEYNFGEFSPLQAIQRTDVAKGLRQYRKMDEHPGCLTLANNIDKEIMSTLEGVSYNAIIGKLWEYEEIIHPSLRYKADSFLMYYLSAMTPQQIADSIYMICRLTTKEIILIDYDPADCPIDIREIFHREIPGCTIHMSMYSKEFELDGQMTPVSEALYHVMKPET